MPLGADAGEYAHESPPLLLPAAMMTGMLDCMHITKRLLAKDHSAQWTMTLPALSAGNYSVDS